jgi:uncharacterized membrane protein
VPAISETVTINADINAVFDLISRVEEFPLYSDILKQVRKIGPDTYRWVARVQGFTLTWDSIISEFHRPTRLAWKSIRGYRNSGAYTLTAVSARTKVEICLEYSFQRPWMEKLLSPLVRPITRAAASEILARVKDRLERGHSRIPSEEIRHERRKLLRVIAKRRQPRHHP